VHYQVTAMTGRTSDLLEAIGLLREVEPAPEAVGKLALAASIGLLILDILGHVAETTSLEPRLLTVVRAAGDRDPLTRFWWNLLLTVRAGYAHDDPWLGLQHSRENQAIAATIGGERTFLIAHMFLGLNLWFLGRFAEAEQTLERIEAGDRTLGLGGSLRRLSLAWLRADRGALDEARVLAAQLSEYGRATHVAMEESRGRWALAEVLRRMGDLEGAEREVQIALALATPLDHPGILATLSALRLVQGRAGEALAAAEDALARYTTMGACGLFRGGFVRLAHAEALHATGAHDAARRAIADARARVLAIAGRIADPVYRQSFLADVPENARTLALAHAWHDESAPGPSS
jgi:tetratricopeptide (TPR) repeat protein